MIPVIGVMIGMYIITRMLQINLKGKEGRENDFTKAIAWITFIIAVFGVIALVATGFNSPDFNF